MLLVIEFFFISTGRMFQFDPNKRIYKRSEFDIYIVDRLALFAAKLSLHGLLVMIGPCIQSSTSIKQPSKKKHTGSYLIHASDFLMQTGSNAEIFFWSYLHYFKPALRSPL